MASPSKTTAVPTPEAASRWRRRVGSFSLICVSAFVTYAVGEHLLRTRLPRLMLGKWLVIEGGFEGSTVQFFRDGTMVSTLRKDGATQEIQGIVQLEGTQLWVTTRDQRGGKETTDMLTLLELSAEQFVTQDQRGEILLMKRLR